MEFIVDRYCNLDRGDEQASCLSTLVCLPFLTSRVRTVCVIALFDRYSDGRQAGAVLLSCPVHTGC